MASRKYRDKREKQLLHQEEQNNDKATLYMMQSIADKAIEELEGVKDNISGNNDSHDQDDIFRSKTKYDSTRRNLNIEVPDQHPSQALLLKNEKDQAEHIARINQAFSCLHSNGKPMSSQLLQQNNNSAVKTSYRALGP